MDPITILGGISTAIGIVKGGIDIAQSLGFLKSKPSGGGGGGGGGILKHKSNTLKQWFSTF
jgi:hypothetical protein